MTGTITNSEGPKMNRLLASTAFALVMALMLPAAAQAQTGGISKAIKGLKGITDDVIEGGVKAGKRLDNVIDDAVQGGVKGGRQLDGVADDVIDGGVGAVGRAVPPADNLLDDVGEAAARGANPPKAPSFDGYDDIDVVAKQLGDGAGAPKAPDLDAYDDIDILSKQLGDAAGDGAPRNLDQAGQYVDYNELLRRNADNFADRGGGQYDDVSELLKRNAEIDPNAHYGDADLLRQLNDEALQNAPRYVDPTPRTNYANPNDIVKPDNDIYLEQFIGIDELNDMNRKAAALGDDLGGVARAAPPKPKKPPMTKVGVTKTTVKAVRQLPAAPVLKAAVPAVSVKAAKAAKKGLSKTAKVMIGGAIGVTTVSIVAGTTFVLYETVEPVRDGIDTAVTETGEGLNTFKTKVDDGFGKVGEVLHPGDPASITFYNNAGTLVELYKIDRTGNETALAILSIEGERETVDVRIGDRISVHKGGVPANEFYDVTSELNGGEIYVQ